MKPEPHDYIQLLFRRSYGIFGGLIAWWGSSVRGYSHVDAKMPGRYGGLIGARDDQVRPPGWPQKISSGIQWRPNDYQKFKYADLVTIPVAPVFAERWCFFQWDGLGLQYDQDAILAFLFGTRWHSKGHWICSARQYAGLVHAALIGKTWIPPQHVTPDALFILAASIPGAVVTPVKGQPLWHHKLLNRLLRRWPPFRGLA